MAQLLSSVYGAGERAAFALCRARKTSVVAEQRSHSSVKVSTKQLTNGHLVLMEGFVSGVCICAE